MNGLAVPERKKPAGNTIPAAPGGACAPRPHPAVVVAGGTSAALGLLVLAGWVTGSVELVQVLPWLVPMQYNTALSFLVCGGGLLAISAGRPRLAMAAGGAAAAIGLLTLFQYLLGVDLGIDRLLLVPYILVGTSHPGRMAPNTALCFALVGAALALMGSSKRSGRRPLLLGLLGSTVIALGVVALSGYLSGLTAAYGWGGFTRMAVHTAVGVTVLGTGVIAFAWHDGPAAAGPPRRLPVLVGIGVATATMCVWQALVAHESAQIRRTVDQEVKGFAAEISEAMRGRLLGLARIAVRWESQGVAPRGEWEADARFLMDHYPGFQAIAWIDPSFRVRGIVPSAGNEAALGFDFGSERRPRTALEEARDRQGVTLARPVDLVQGGRGFLAFAPIFRDGELLGFIGGAFRMQELFGRILDRDLRRGYAVSVLESGQEIYGLYGAAPPDDAEWVGEAGVDLYGMTWSVRVWPTPELLDEGRSSAPTAALVVGLLTALLLVRSVHLAQTARLRAIALASVNRGLQDEIARREQMEEALRLNEGKYLSVVNNVREVIFQTDAAGRWTFLNPAWSEITGFTLAESIGTSFLDCVHPEDRERNRELFQPLLQGRREHCRHETRYLTKDGGFRWIEVQARLTLDADDSVLGTSGTLNDVTVRKLAEEAHSQLAAIVESSSDAIVGLTPEGVIRSWNAGAEKLYGYAAGEVMGRSVFLLIPSERLEDDPGILSRLRRGEHIQHYETVRVAKDGRRIDVSLTVSPVLDSAGRVVGVSSISRDITEQKALQRMKDEFVGTVSHELRTPLTAIKGHIELVLDGDAGALTDLQRQFLDVAARSTDRLGALINDVLDMEKIEAGKIQLRTEPVDLSMTLREVGTTFRVVTERKGLVFREEIADLLVVLGDRDRLIQIFSNLLSNAIKYTPGGEVGIRAARLDGHVEVEVHDTGVGISEDEQRQLFSKFFRSQEPVVLEAGGTGLGLAIAKGIVERLGGSIGVESRKGAGTRFRVVLPATVVESAEPRPAEAGQATVLVVEDTPAVRNLVLEHVRRLGHLGVGAASGSEGLGLARRLVPDLVVLDVLVPAPDGWEVLAQLKADPATRHIPIVVHTVIEDRERAHRLGAADYLVKPVGAARLRETIQAALRNRLVPVFVVDPDPALGERLERELGEAVGGVRQVRRLEEARTIRPVSPSVFLVSREMPDGDSGDLVRAWRRDPAFREAVILLVGEWPSEADRPDEMLLPVERVNGTPSETPDLAGQVRRLIDRRRRARHG